MSIIRHQFADATEANAFAAGVGWVNDDAISIISVEDGLVVTEDDDDWYGATITYVANGDGTYTLESEATNV